MASKASPLTSQNPQTPTDAKSLGALSIFGISLGVLLTLLLIAAATIHFTGYSDDMATWMAKKYYGAKAKAEAVALANVGGEKAQDFLKDSLKKNPVMGSDELDQVDPGLGGEAVKDGLAGVSGKLGGLGKF